MSSGDMIKNEGMGCMGIDDMAGLVKPAEEAVGL